MSIGGISSNIGFGNMKSVRDSFLFGVPDALSLTSGAAKV